MTKYLNMAPACYQADDSKSGAHLLMAAGAAATAVYTSLDPDNGKSHRNAVGGHAISWTDGFVNTVRVCPPASGVDF